MTIRRLFRLKWEEETWGINTTRNGVWKYPWCRLFGHRATRPICHVANNECFRCVCLRCAAGHELCKEYGWFEYCWLIAKSRCGFCRSRRLLSWRWDSYLEICGACYRREVAGARKPSSKRYLGNAVYAGVDERGIVLTAEDGIRVTNTIVLEPEVIAALEEYLKERSAT